MSEGQKNHCGPDSWPDWARAFISQDPIFNKGCYNHDFDYLSMGQKEADKKLYKYLKEIIGSWYKNPYRRFKAWMFYKNVRAFGKKAWLAAQAKRKNK